MRFRADWNGPKRFFPLLLGFLCGVLSCFSSEDAPTIPESIAGVSDTQIMVGASLALTGHASYLGTQSLQGAMSYIRHINELGGIYGRSITVIAHDDGYDPSRCLANTQRLIIQDKVFTLFCYVGTPTTLKIIPVITEARIPVVGMLTGADALRSPVNRYLINVRASYYQETGAAVGHMVGDLGIDKIAVFYQYDAYGFDGLRGTELALKQYGLVPVAKGTYIRGTLAVEKAMASIADSGAEAVVMIGTYDLCANFITLAKHRGYAPLFYCVSFVGADELARRLGADGDGVIVSQVVPPPRQPPDASPLWGIAEYTALLSKYYPESLPNFVGMEGYLNARVLVEGLRRAGRNLDREGFIDAIESIQHYDAGTGTPLNFGPADHQGFDRVYFTRIENGKFELITDWRGIPRKAGSMETPFQALNDEKSGMNGSVQANKP
ncbi:MAG: ABC transporter substrate-binding protein [Desulfobacterales bacterium]|jgi:ABC-type branched-subunit amino acid transport system substrate-binding protein|nr:ABC transporter substrate-binding protein [Desulfobacterales bacterium]